MARTKGFTEDDLRAWAAVSRTVRLLPGKKPVAEPPPPAPPMVTLPGRGLPPAPPGPGAPPAIGAPPAGLDRASWQKFRLGRIRPERRLDLHGMTAARAHRATLCFLRDAHADGRRCVEIITGNGAILARELPLWLQAPPLRALILALTHPNPGNAGALRILLRRSRT